MKFSSVKHDRMIAQCPPVISPRRIVREVAEDGPLSDSFLRLNRLRGKTALGLYYQSRTLFRGFFSTIFFGLFSVIPMLLQIFFPKESKTLKRGLDTFIAPDPKTQLALDQSAPDVGYSHIEMTDIVESILKMCGMTEAFSRLVILLAHGSTSNNNPFKQAYGCGACGGNAGIPNSRAFAKMANHPVVRSILTDRGLFIPAATVFISGFHDTCTDEISYFDTEAIPTTHQQEFQQVVQKLNRACELNAFERCQRFSSPLAKSSIQEAVEHVKDRAHDMAQPRPEYGHSSNALAIVGRRELSKGLFLNRRAFLLTYDWRIDPDGSILKQVVLGGIPVAVNINMDYYFSRVDNDNYGCGSKLPLNLTSLLGVMTGSQSDLRIGLARQMVEIHEPIRNLTVIESPLARVKDIFDNHPRLKKLLYHQWMRLAVHDPLDNIWYLFKNDSFLPWEVESASLKCYATSIDVLKNHHESEFAEVKS
jgi:uncharacterized protein